MAFPSPDVRYTLTTDRAGPEALLAFLSTRPLELNGISAYETASAPFATSKLTSLEQLSTALKQAASQVPGNTFAEDRGTLLVTAP